MPALCFFWTLPHFFFKDSNNNKWSKSKLHICRKNQIRLNSLCVSISPNFDIHNVVINLTCCFCTFSMSFKSQLDHNYCHIVSCVDTQKNVVSKWSCSKLPPSRNLSRNFLHFGPFCVIWLRGSRPHASKELPPYKVFWNSYLVYDMNHNLPISRHFLPNIFKKK